MNLQAVLKHFAAIIVSAMPCFDDFVLMNLFAKSFWEIDFARGFAVVMMVVFHFAWDLDYFGLLSGNVYSGFFGILQKATAVLFLLLAGISISISYLKRGKRDYTVHFLKRGAVVFSIGLLITLFTFIFFRSEFIYFGILHLIGVSIILSIPFAGKRLPAFAFGILTLILPAAYNLASLNQPLLVWLGFSHPLPTLDYFPVFPWFGIILIGISIGDFLYRNPSWRVVLGEPKNMATGFIRLLGSNRNSLIIYLLHQAILFPVSFLLSVLLSAG